MKTYAFIDASNLFYGGEKSLGWKIDYKKLLEKNPDDYFGISAGTGVMIGDILIDCAYVYRWGRDVKGDALPIQKTDADEDQHKLFVSMIYHF